MTKQNNEELKDLCIMELMEQITELSRKKGNPKKVANLPSVSPYASELGNRLSITPREAVILSLFVNFYPDSEIVSMQLATHLACSNLAVMACYEDIKKLKSKYYIREHKSDDGIEYYVPMVAITAFRENHDIEKTDYRNMSSEELFSEIDRMFRERGSGSIDLEQLYDTLVSIISSNPQLSFCHSVNEYRLDKEDWILLLNICRVFYFSPSSTFTTEDVRRIIPMRNGMNHVRLLRANKHPLQVLHIIEPAGGELASEQEWILTHRVAKDLFQELCPTLMNGTRKGVINADAISEKSLFYPAQTAEQMHELELLLMPDKFDRIQDSLMKHGMRKGFACLFYGAPGTGKTESVLQLARKTGRSIMQVDMSQMRDKYVGESEKNVKQIFTTYRRLCRESDLTPILLLNEADALLSMRLTDMKDSVDQMANTMQNIILQEMETMEGILIATTNLIQNLDAAFERRFLYKVEFFKPTAEESRHIWQAMLPALSEENARSLAAKYDFSGGQIENIARKQVVSNILHEREEVDLALICKACDTERLIQQNEHIRITGFC